MNSKNPLIIFLFTITLIYSPRIHAETYYVAKTGDDNNNGSISRPWLTIGKAAKTMVAGDTVLIRQGFYEESIKTTRSGLPGKPITYKAFKSQKVIVDGSREVTGWVRDSEGPCSNENRYKAKVYFIPDPMFSAVRDPLKNRGGLILQNGAKMNYAMARSRCDVDSEGKYFMEEGGSPPFTLYVYFRNLGAGYDPNNYNIRVGDKRKGIDLDGGEDYINVEGLTFRGYNDNAIHTIESTHNSFRNLTIYSNFITGIYLTSKSNYNIIEGNTFWDNGHAGIELLNVDYTTIRNNLFTKVDMGNGDGGNGAHIWFVGMGKANHNVIENNVGLRTGGDYNIKDSEFIRIVGNYNIIRHNSAMDFGGIGIAVMHGKGNIVINNAIDCTRGKACINIFKPAVLDGGNRIEYNVFYAKNPKEKYGWNGSMYDNLNAWKKVSGYENNNGNDPGFIDPANGNLRLSKDSYCIDGGTGENASIEDFDGTPRPVGEGYDIGAFEYK